MVDVLGHPDSLAPRCSGTRVTGGGDAARLTTGASLLFRVCETLLFAWLLEEWQQCTPEVKRLRLLDSAAGAAHPPGKIGNAPGSALLGGWSAPRPTRPQQQPPHARATPTQIATPPPCPPTTHSRLPSPPRGPRPVHSTPLSFEQAGDTPKAQPARRASPQRALPQRHTSPRARPDAGTPWRCVATVRARAAAARARCAFLGERLLFFGGGGHLVSQPSAPCRRALERGGSGQRRRPQVGHQGIGVGAHARGAPRGGGRGRLA